MTSGYVKRTLSAAGWREEAERRFGPNGRDIQFRCVSCGEVQTAGQFVELGFTPDEAMNRVSISCIGRWAKDRGCDWTLGGLFQFHELEVVTEDGRHVPCFEFATPDNAFTPGHRVLGKKRVNT